MPSEGQSIVKCQSGRGPDQAFCDRVEQPIDVRYEADCVLRSTFSGGYFSLVEPSKSSRSLEVSVASLKYDTPYIMSFRWGGARMDGWMGIGA